jgi:patatin-related protein
MALDDIRIHGVGNDEQIRGWTEQFAKDYLQKEVSFRTCAFGDGGYLDNKPFSYATDTLQRRRSDRVVERKILYVEPSPEHPEDTSVRTDKPDFVQNALAALVTLPGYETIREDIRRILDRNRLIERVTRITGFVERDVAAGGPRRQPAEGRAYAEQDLAEMIRQKGASYGGYHRLKIAALTDELTELITRLAGFDAESDEFRAIRYLVRAWRDNEYVDSRRAANGTEDRTRPSQNQLLLDLDLSYRLRRINFLRAKIDDLYALDDPARDTISLLPDGPALRAALDASNFDAEDFRRELLAIKQQLGRVFVTLRRLGRNLRAGREEGKRLRDLIASTAITSDGLRSLLRIATEAWRAGAAEWVIGDPSLAAAFQCITRELAEQLRPGMIAAAAECHTAVDPRTAASPAARIARQCLQHYYNYYDDYDMIIFPITYGTDVGESDTVEVIRISPEDATTLVDQRKTGCHKLAGEALFHFGGFLDRTWRKNDILWGRLDGAERIITAMLPEHPYQASRLIREAHTTILEEEIQLPDCQGPYRDLVESLLRKAKGQSATPACTVDHPLDPKTTLRSAARATTVTGKMLEGLADDYRSAAKPAAAWVTRIGLVFWGLVEVAVPRSFASLLFRYWLQLLYLSSVITFLGGWVFSAQAAQRFGVAAFALTLLVHAGVLLLNEYLRGAQSRLQFVKRTAVVIGVLLALLGAIALRGLLVHRWDAWAALFR